MRIVLPGQVAQALERLAREGFEAYIVGGCVRDQLLGRQPYDWDIATGALPQDIASCFSSWGRVVPTGLRHGTVTVIPPGGVPIEITTFRVDGTYSDHRRPDSVGFTDDVVQDLSRRDFTVNAMAYHPQRGLLDPFHGAQDLQAGLLRCVGDPDVRFEEDALRILRALRFMAQLSFRIEPRTHESLVRRRELLREISAERIAYELNRLLCGECAGEVIRRYTAVLGVPIPELLPMAGLNQRNPYHLYDVLEHTVRVVENVRPILEVRLAAMLHDCGKPDCFTIDEDGIGHFYSHPAHSERHAREILTRLRFDNKTKELVCFLVEHHDAYIPPEIKPVRRWLARVGERKLRMLIELKRGDCIGQGTNPQRIVQVNRLEELLDGILSEGGCLSLKDLAVNGRDLLALGIPAGPQVGAVLKELLRGVLDGELRNDRDTLLLHARRLLLDPRRFIDESTFGEF